MYNKICVRHTHALPLPSPIRLTAHRQLGGRGRERGRPRRRGRPHNATSEKVSCPRSTLWDSAGCSHSSIERVAPGPKAGPGCRHPSWEEGRWYVGLRVRKGREKAVAPGRDRPASLRRTASPRRPLGRRQTTGRRLDAGDGSRGEAARLALKSLPSRQPPRSECWVSRTLRDTQVRSSFRETAARRCLRAHNPPS